MAPQMNPAHAPGLVEMRVGPFHAFAALPQQPLPARPANPPAVGIHGVAGHCRKANVLRCLNALEAVLRRNGFDPPPNAGVDAAYDIYGAEA